MAIRIHNETTESIFRLIGKNENALTYALGYVFSRNTEFLVEFLKTFNIIEKRQGLSHKKISEKPFISLQHFVDDNSGIKDILIEWNGYRVVIEAKTDNSSPNDVQILKYANLESNKDWNRFEKKYIVLLTRKQLLNVNFEFVLEQLDESNIKLIQATWSEVFGMLRKYLFLDDKTADTFILGELAKFLFEDYEMEIIEKEVLYRKVLKDHYHRVCNRDGNGYYFDGGRQNFIYPSCQFFQACYGPARTSTKTGEYIRRIKKYQMLHYEEIITNADAEMREVFQLYLEQFPHDGTSALPIRFHVFTLGKKIEIHPSKSNFSGSELGYTDLEYLLTY